MLTLVIGNYNLSSWSLRPWLVLETFGIPFATVRIELEGPHRKSPAVKAAILARSPSGHVPALEHDGLTIWDSLAICEHLAETFGDRHLWPRDKAARAIARSVSAEMHSSFSAMRNVLWMNFRATTPLAELTGDVAADVGRVQDIWRGCRRDYGGAGPFLFGEFSIADAMFAPVVSRFTTYAVRVDEVCRRYMDDVWALPAMQKWLGLARQEP
ncbi:MAG TPA: glutathione S-transferase family protein [Candidatus Limnocylindrales bacterium]|nr:glutathione S-transferase family protein [Candidatus Limnocylindrales bacterium]